MTRDEVIRMARDAGASQLWAEYHALFGDDAIERFAALVAAAEREACAAICEDQRDLREEARAALRVADTLDAGDEDEMLSAFRHESNVSLYNSGLNKAIAAIRARGEK